MDVVNENGEIVETVVIGPGEEVGTSVHRILEIGTMCKMKNSEWHCSSSYWWRVKTPKELNNVLDEAAAEIGEKVEEVVEELKKKYNAKYVDKMSLIGPLGMDVLSVLCGFNDVFPADSEKVKKIRKACREGMKSRMLRELAIQMVRREMIMTGEDVSVADAIRYNISREDP